MMTYKSISFEPIENLPHSPTKLIDNAPSEVWDGSYKNAIVPQDAYSWIADVTFLSGVRKVFNESVTVLR